MFLEAKPAGEQVAWVTLGRRGQARGQVDLALLPRCRRTSCPGRSL